MKILYIEHDGDNLYMLKTRLKRSGDFEVLAAEDSEQGCKLAVTEHPDVRIVDAAIARRGAVAERPTETTPAGSPVQATENANRAPSKIPAGSKT
jgi:hypothetical protein